MKNKVRLARAFAAILFAFGSLAGGAHGAIVLQVDVSSPTTINIVATGTLDGPAPGVNSNMLFIDAPVGSTQIFFSIAGDFQIGPGNLTASNFGFANTPYQNPIQLRFWDVSALNIGDSVAFSGTLTSTVPHNLTNASLNGVNIYWGRETFVTAGTIQGQVTTVPEPSSALLLSLGVMAVVGRRRRG